MLHELFGYKNDDIPMDEVQHHLDGSKEQRCARYTVKYENNFTGSELKLRFFAPLQRRYCIKYAEMTVRQAE